MYAFCLQSSVTYRNYFCRVNNIFLARLPGERPYLPGSWVNCGPYWPGSRVNSGLIGPAAGWIAFAFWKGLGGRGRVFRGGPGRKSGVFRSSPGRKMGGFQAAHTRTSLIWEYPRFPPPPNVTKALNWNGKNSSCPADPTVGVFISLVNSLSGLLCF